MSSEHIVQTSITAKREREAKKHAWEDILYLLMGSATISDALVLLITIILFGTVPAVMFLLFANYSGGMRWLLTLGICTFLGVLAIILMERGIRKKRLLIDSKEVKTEYPGQLTELNEAVGRGQAGYVYSQQMLRERLCETIIHKLALARDMSEEDIILMLEKGDYSIIDDELLAKFLEKYRRGSTGWDKGLVGKGKSEERGRRFMDELDIILDRIEEIV